MAVTGQVYWSLDSVYNPNIGYQDCFVPVAGDRQLFFFQLPILLMIVVSLLGYVSVIIKTLRSGQSKKGEVKKYLVRKIAEMQKITNKLNKLIIYRLFIPKCC